MLSHRMLNLLAALYVLATLAVTGYSVAAFGQESTTPTRHVQELAPYIFPIQVDPDDVYDGDTVTAQVSWLPPSVVGELAGKNAKLRLYGINTPEIRGGTAETKAAGYNARDFLRAIMHDRELRLELVRSKRGRYTGKYGRWLARIWVKGIGTWCPEGVWCDANAYLVQAGHAQVYLP